MSSDKNLADELLKQDAPAGDEPRALAEMVKLHQRHLRRARMIALVSFFGLIVCYFAFMGIGAYRENVVGLPTEQSIYPPPLLITIALILLVLLPVSAVSWYFRWRSLGTEQILACLVRIEQEIRQLKDALAQLQTANKGRQ